MPTAGVRNAGHLQGGTCSRLFACGNRLSGIGTAFRQGLAFLADCGGLSFNTRRSGAALARGVGAKTPWHLVRFARGAGTRDSTRRNSSSPVKSRCVVPSGTSEWKCGVTCKGSIPAASMQRSPATCPCCGPRPSRSVAGDRPIQSFRWRCLTRRNDPERGGYCPRVRDALCPFAAEVMILADAPQSPLHLSQQGKCSPYLPGEAG